MENENGWRTRFFFVRTNSRGDIDILWKRVIAVVAIIIIFLVVVPSTMVTVPAGYKGIRTQFGKVTGVLDEGLHFRLWFAGENIELMNIQIQKAVKTESAASSDLQEITTEVVVNFRLNPSYVENIYVALRQDYDARVIDPNIDESLKATTAQFTANEIIQRRSEVKYVFLHTLRDRLEQFHIEVLSVSLTDFQFSPEFTAAIEAANTAKQKAIEALNYLEQVKHEAQQKVIQAQANYNATILNAQAAAKATVLEAEAKAEAIRLVNEQLTGDYIQYIMMQQWDGQLPYFYGSDAPLPFLWLGTNSTATP